MDDQHIARTDARGLARWIAGGAALAGVAGIVLGQTLLAPEYEILYSGGVSAEHCLVIDGRQLCTFVYEFSIGNTGKSEQGDLRVEWPLDMHDWYVGTQAVDIVASARNAPRPRLAASYPAGTTVYTIDRLAPNVVVDFKVRCMACAPEHLEAMRDVRVGVVARGSVSETDPRVSALRRGVMNLLRIAGLLR